MIKKRLSCNFFRIIFFCVGLAGLSANAKEFENSKLSFTTGTATSNLRFDDAPDAQYEDAKFETMLDLENLRFKGDFRVYLEHSNRDYQQFSAREIYGDGSNGNLRIDIGRKIIVWGKADIINPTDKFVRRDYRLLGSDNEDQRLGVDGLFLSYNMQYGNVQWVVEALPRVSEFQFSVPLSIKQEIPSRPATGIRFDHYGQGFDFGISAYLGHDDLPYFQHMVLSPLSTTQSNDVLILHYNPITMVGSDFALANTYCTLKGEIAYTHAQERPDDGPFRRHSNLVAVLGFQPAPFYDTDLILQYFFLHVQNYASPSRMDQTAQQTAIIGNELKPDQSGASLRVSHSFDNEAINAEIIALFLPYRNQSRVEPKISWTPADNYSVSVGAKLYRGSVDSLCGFFKDNSLFYFELNIFM